MLRHRRIALACVALLLATSGSLPTMPQLAVAVAPSAIGAPQLKWAYGGCFSSWCQTGWYSSPAVADLDGDRQPEVIWGSYDLVALNGADGSQQWRAPSGNRVWPAVAVADLTGDGSLELVVGRGGDELTVYNASGTALWTAHPFGGGEVRTLAVADLERDGRQEIVVGRASGGSTRQLSVFEASGTARTGWPARRDGEPGYGWGMYNQNVTVADLDGDGFKEVYGPTDTHYITALDRNGNQLRVSTIYPRRQFWSEVGVHVDHAADVRGYAECGTEHRPNFANSAPAAADLDGDGSQELIVVGDVYNCAVGDPDGDMYLLPWILKQDRTRWSGAGVDWTVLPTPAPNSAPLSQDYSRIENNVINTVVADLDGDGRKEIIYPSYDGRLHAYWLDKTQHGNWPWDVPGSGIRFASEPAVADLDGDGKAELIVASWPEKVAGRLGQLHILDYQGRQLQAVDLPAPRSGTVNGSLGAPTIADIDGDADLEVVVGTVASGVVAYDLPGSAGARILWGTGRGSLKRSGVPPGSGFSLQLSPSARAILPRSTAVYSISVVPGEAGGGAVTLSVPAAVSGLALTLAPSTLTPPATAILTVTDTAAASPAPGVFYSLPISASDGVLTRTLSAGLLVGGQRLYQPLGLR